MLTLAAGALFGLAAGTLIVSFASTLGATLAFLGSRFLLRDWVQSALRRQAQGDQRRRGQGRCLLPLHAAPGAGLPVLRHQPRDGTHAHRDRAPSTG
ncbi:MAG: hypothetical protein MZW92_68385 [Comamonadaceae bacterium]|nr:hypothetical protein [Comamonadaceae bacterium]